MMRLHGQRGAVQITLVGTLIATAIVGIAVGTYFAYRYFADQQVKQQVHEARKKIVATGAVDIEGEGENVKRPTLAEVRARMGVEPAFRADETKDRTAEVYEWNSPLKKYQMYLVFKKDKKGVHVLQKGKVYGGL